MTEALRQFLIAFRASRLKRKDAARFQWKCRHCGVIDARTDSICWNCGGSLAQPETRQKTLLGGRRGLNRPVYSVVIGGLGTLNWMTFHHAPSAAATWVAILSSLVALIAVGKRWVHSGGNRLDPIELFFPVYLVLGFFLPPPGTRQDWSSRLPVLGKKLVAAVVFLLGGLA